MVRRFLQLALYIGLSTSIQDKPNIIFILADDLGWNDVGFHGMTDIPTPNIDALASESTIIHNYYTSPMCTPSRSAIFSGYYPHKTGLQNYVIPESGDWGLPLELSTLPDRLRELDYENHLIGKWHLGFYKTEFTPTKRGFQSHFGFWSGGIDFIDHQSESGAPADQYKNKPNNITDTERITFVGHDFKSGLKSKHLEGNYLTDLLTVKAVDTIMSHNTSKPLFLFLAQHAVHRGNPLKPMFAPDVYTEGFSYIQDAKRRNFAGCLKALDLSVGQVIETLSKKGILNNSVIVFSSDNGADVEFLSSNGGSNWPLRGQKFTPWEGGVRGIGMIWTSSILNRTGVWNGLMHVADWYPTILSIAGYDPKRIPVNIDGKSMWNAWKTNSTSPREEIVLSLDPIWNISSLRLGDFKVISGSFPHMDLNGWYGNSGRDLRVAFFSEESHKVKELLATAHTSSENRDGLHSLAINCNEIINEKRACDPLIKPCLFNIAKDPCELNNLAENEPNTVNALMKRIREHQMDSVPPLTGKRDFQANPDNHAGEWVPWQSI